MSDFYCVKCKNKGISINRRAGRERPSGHLKKLWCLNCQEEINHVEIQEFATNYTHEDFCMEYEYGNFDEHQNRILPFGEFKTKLNKEGLL